MNLPQQEQTKNTLINCLCPFLKSCSEMINLSEETLQTVNQFFWNHASDDQLAVFIREVVCGDENSLYSSGFTLDFFSKLTLLQMTRLVSLDNMTSPVIYALNSSINHPKTTFLLLKLFYKKSPEHPIWEKIKIADFSSEFFIFKHFLIAYEVVQVFFSQKDESQSKKFSEDIEVQLKKITCNTLYEYPAKLSATQIFENLEIPEEWQLIAFTKVMLNIEGFAKADFIYIMQLTKNPLILISLFKAFSEMGQTSEEEQELSRGSLISMLFFIHQKEEAVAFLKACLKLEEPLKTLHLRALAVGVLHKETVLKTDFKLINQVFKDAGLDVSQYQVIVPFNELYCPIVI